MKLVVVGAWVGLIAVALCGPDTAAAQEKGGGAKIAYVNTQAILRATPGYAAAESTFAKELETYRGEVQKLQASLDSAASDFEQQSVLLSPTQRQAKRKELRGPAAEAGAAHAGAAAARFATASGSCWTRSRPRSTASSRGCARRGTTPIIFDVSAPNSGIVTADKSLDLTQRVIQQLKSGT